MSYETLININSDAKNGWGWNAFNTFVKLNPNVTEVSVENQLERMVEKYNLSGEDMIRVFKLQPIENIHLHSNLRHEIGKRSNAFSIYTLAIIAIFILLIAWINYINITTAKTKKQLQSIHLRKVLGSTNKQQLIETIFSSFVLNSIAIMLSGKIIISNV